jgi:hypothetical protein
MANPTGRTGLLTALYNIKYIASQRGSDTSDIGAFMEICIASMENIVDDNGQLPHVIFIPVTTGTVTLQVNNYNLINPAGTLAALTFALPASPKNNDTIEIKSTQVLTAVTFTGGTVVSAPTTIAKDGYVKLVYDSATTSWL